MGSSVLSIDTADTQSGLRRYDIDLLTDGITVTHIAVNQLNPMVSATGLAAGHVYRWRVTATDNVNNVAIANLDVASVATVKTYAFGSQRIAMRAGEHMRWLHGDHLSSVNSMTDETGAVVGRQLYAPYGELRAELGKDGSWGWATHRKAESNGLTFMRARWYAAGIGRFVQADSVVPAPGVPQTFNRYAYASNSPVQRNDPSGHCDICDWFKSFFVSPAQQQSQELKPVVTLLNPTINPIGVAMPQPTAQPTAAPTATPSPTTAPTATPNIDTTYPAPSTTGWVSPVNGSGATSCGFREPCGYSDDGKGHNGADKVSANDPGTSFDPDNTEVPGRKVYAVNDGTYVATYYPDCTSCNWVGTSGSYGRTIEINHVGEHWQYSHFIPTKEFSQEIARAAKLKLKVTVKAGQHIGYYAHIGVSTGPHSHVTRKVLNQNGAWELQDPDKVLPH